MSLNIRIHRDITGEMWFGVRIVNNRILQLSIRTLKRFPQRITLLYEQGSDYLRIEEYVKHWLR